MNETLCRALLQARLTEEDVATRLQVDPKTVRRWLEGRVPYLRHRWAIAAMVGLNETDLWPQLRNAPSRPDDVRAVYPHLGAVPEEVWHQLFSPAEQDIGILTETAEPIAGYPCVLEVLATKALSGVRIRICLTGATESTVASDPSAPKKSASSTGEHHGPLAAFQDLRELDYVEIRISRAVTYSTIYRADDQVLVSQRAYGIPALEAPVLHLCVTSKSDVASGYLTSFADVWTSAQAPD